MQTTAQIIPVVKVDTNVPSLMACMCLLWFTLAYAPSSFAQNKCNARCPDGSMSEAFDCNSNYVPACMRRAPAPRNVDNDAGVAQRAQAAAAATAEQRQRDAELEQQRIEAEKRRTEEIAKQAQFNQDKQQALGELKGISNTGDFDSDSGLQGVGSAALGLKDVPNSPDSVGLKTLPDVNTDTPVVDARNVPTGLPKSVEDSIPHTPAGDRVRKGFEAIQTHDWKVALAWFEDALNHDPGNGGIQRLIDLAEYTMKRANRPHTSAPPAKPVADTRSQDKAAVDKQMDSQMNADLARSLDAFNRNYFLKHPELLKQVKPSAPAQTTKPAPANSAPEPQPPDQKGNWKAFFDSIFTRPPRVLIPTSVAGIRG